MSQTIKVTVEHPGDHEPNGESFADDLATGLTDALHAAGLKRGEGFETKIVGYVQTSGVSTVYLVEVDGAEPTAAALKAEQDAADAKAKADARKQRDDEAVAAVKAGTVKIVAEK